MKIKTIIFNFLIFSVFLTPTIHAASDLTDQELLLKAAENGNLEGVKKLIEAGIDPNTTDDFGRTPLMLASRDDHFGIVKYLLKIEGVKPNLQDNDGFTALIFATIEEFENIVKLLLEHNADPNLQNNDGFAALIMASYQGFENIVKLLLKHNVNPNLQMNNGFTALMFASAEGFENIVKLLLEHNADPNLQMNNENTALIIASRKGFENIVKLLLKHNANPNLQNNNGFTALISASRKGFENIVKLLLEHNADINLQRPDGSTALDQAKVTGNTKIVKILMSFVIEKNLAITEEERQKLSKKQDGIDLISMDDITKEKEPLDKLMILGKYLFLRKTIMDHMISKVGSEEDILDPFTREPISAAIQDALLGYFELPLNLLKRGGPIYKDARDLQQRENLIQMIGEPEVEEDKKELKELEDDAAGLRKRIRDTLERRYNYSYAE